MGCSDDAVASEIMSPGCNKKKALVTLYNLHHISRMNTPIDRIKVYKRN